MKIKIPSSGWLRAGVIKSNGEATTILTAQRVVQELQNALKDMLSIRL